MTSTTSVRALLPAVVAMGLIILASNILVKVPVQLTVAGFDFANWVTFGALTYPVAFLVTDTVNRLRGAGDARKVVYVGFLVGAALSLALADLRIALASVTAFLIGQLLDVFVFDRLRKLSWWKAPLVSSALGSAVDTGLFFSLAFAGTVVPWTTLAMGDFIIKLAMATLLLPVFRGLMAILPTRPRNTVAAA